MDRRRFLLTALAASARAQTTGDARNSDPPHTDTHFRMPAYRTLSDWQARAAHLRKQILSSAGLYPLPEKQPLNPRVFGRIDNRDCSIEKVALETLPGYYLCGNLYRPMNRAGKFPGVVSPHGHWSYGRLEHTELGSIPARCINLARQGYVVFAYDMVGYNDTIQTPHAFGNERQQLWSFGPLGLQLWNSIRAVDFLQSLPDVDAERIAATGASGGGTQTFLLAAVDDRVKYAAPVNMISAIMQGGSPCENAPGLRIGTSNMEIAATIAPRPLLMVSATGDWTRNTPREEFPAVHSIYELFRQPARLEQIQIDAPHNYNKDSREAMYRFFGKHVLGVDDPAQFKEKSIRVEPLQNMLVWHGQSMPVNAVKFEQIEAQWIDASKKQSAAVKDAAMIRERLSLALAAEWPSKVLSEERGERLFLTREGRGDRIPAVRLGTDVPRLIVVHEDGADTARRHADVEPYLARKQSVLLIDAFQTGMAQAPRNRSTRYFTTFNKTDDAERVQDILTAAAWLRQNGAGSVEALGIGRAGVWTLFAAAVAPEPIRWLGNLSGFTGTDDEFVRHFFVPGILRAGGLNAARVLTSQ